MDYSATFARHFSRLISLLMHEVSEVDEQKVLLRALVAVNKDGAVALFVDGKRLLANDRAVPSVLAGVQLVVSQFQAHSLRRVRIAAGSKAADLLGVARIVAGAATAGDGGAHVRKQLAALHAKSAIEIETVAPAARESSKTPAAPAPAEKPPRKSAAADAASVLSELAATDVRALSVEELIAQLEKVRSPQAATKVLDDAVALAEHSVRAGKHIVAADILNALIERETRAKTDEQRRAYAVVLRRLLKQSILRGVAKLVATNAQHKKRYLPILERASEDGASAVIALLGQATTRADRQLLLGILEAMEHAVPALIGMLDDSRWYAVRNAADLLGELVAADAADALIALVHHSDDRVRRAATAALLKIGTPEALRAVYDAVDDASPEVRMQAAAALSTKRDGRTTATLIKAIDAEQDGDVQIAMIAALGKIGTNDAVQKLVKMAVPDGRLFRKKTNVLRVAAVQALGDAKTAAAIAVLRELTDDKDREVRETAARALAHVGR